MNEAKFTQLRISEGRALEILFEGEWCQIASLHISRWSHPDDGKNTRFREFVKPYDLLFLAAPEMYEALKEWEHDIETLGGTTDATENLICAAFSKAVRP
jgi:hypothetical protein